MVRKRFRSVTDAAVFMSEKYSALARGRKDTFMLQRQLEVTYSFLGSLRDILARVRHRKWNMVIC